MIPRLANGSIDWGAIEGILLILLLSAFSVWACLSSVFGSER